MSKDTNRKARQRIDDKYSLLLQEYRVFQPGVQVLFAFLLTFPFYSRFSEVTEYQKWIYAGALLSASLSAVLFMAPASQHHVLSGQGLKHVILEFAYHTGQAALGLLLISMGASLFIAFDVTFNIWIAAVFTLIFLVFATVFWYLYAFKLRRNND